MGGTIVPGGAATTGTSVPGATTAGTSVPGATTGGSPGTVASAGAGGAAAGERGVSEGAKCPRGGGELLAVELRYSGKASVTRVGCKGLDSKRIGGPLPAVKSLESDHFDLLASDGKVIFHGIWSNPFVSREAPMDDKGRMGWTSAELSPPVTFELLVPNDPRGVEVVLIAAAKEKKNAGVVARIKVR